MMLIMSTKENARRTASPIFKPSDVEDFLVSLLSEDLHAMRIRSLADATLGVLHSGSLGVHAIGRGLAVARGLVDKHAVKQIDRLLSNIGIDVWDIFSRWVPSVIGESKDVLINLDWTEFDGDNQTMLVASLQTAHGRSAPLVWLTVRKTELKNMTNEYEFKLLRRLKDSMPENVQVTIVADRGFADPALFVVIKNELEWNYIVRFKALILVTSEDGITKPANDWLGMYGRMRVLRNVTLTAENYPVATVVCVCAKDMIEAWCLACSNADADGRHLIKKYGKRFTIEEMFRDVKDIHYGMGMSWNAIGTPERRDRMFLLAAFAQSLLTMLGQAGEDLGLDRLLKTNTSKKRTLSLFRQGLMWYERIPTMPEIRLAALMTRFSELMIGDNFFGPVLGGK
jgi:hypothetical protein